MTQASDAQVLIVEDNPAVRRIARRCLELNGLRVAEAETADEALSMCVALKASLRLVVADHMLPGMSGAELVTRLRAIGGPLGVILMSGYAKAQLDDATDVDLGIPFLPKPFTMDELITAVRAVLAQAA